MSQAKKLEIELLHWQKLEHVPSASAIVKYENNFFIIGDDSPFLFCFDHNFNLLSQTQIYGLTHLNNNQIPKFHKPDFEAMTLVNNSELLIFGSGSKSPERDVCVRVFLDNEFSLEQFDLFPFYNQLRQMDVMNGYELDLEAVIYDGKRLHLFNRGRNIIFTVDYKDLMTYLQSGNASLKISHQLVVLPEIEGIRSGFSDATFLVTSQTVLFTATVENSPNAYDDGEILGSFLGFFKMNGYDIATSFITQQIPNPGFPLKIEAIAIDRIISDHQLDLILATDNDGAPSEILKVRLTIK